MADIRYELRIQFDSPSAMGEGVDVAARALIEAGVPMRTVQPDWVAIEDGEERPLTDVEEAAVDAGLEQAGPDAGTLEIDEEGS